MALLQQDWCQPPLANLANKMVVMWIAAFEHLHHVKFSRSGESTMQEALLLAPEWVQTLKDLGFRFHDIYHISFHMISEKLLPGLKTHLRSSDGAGKHKPRPYRNLSVEEKQVLHYASGYIPRKLLRSYKRSPQNKAAQFCKDVVSCWAH